MRMEAGPAPLPEFSLGFDCVDFMTAASSGTALSLSSAPPTPPFSSSITKKPTATPHRTNITEKRGQGGLQSPRDSAVVGHTTHSRMMRLSAMHTAQQSRVDRHTVGRQSTNHQHARCDLLCCHSGALGPKQLMGSQESKERRPQGGPTSAKGAMLCSPCWGACCSDPLPSKQGLVHVL
jgi:hypothetical protein